MVEVSSQPNMTIVLPVPIELLSGGPAQVATAAAARAALEASSSLAAGKTAGQLQAGAPAVAATSAALEALLADGKP
jgi:hypothetical protein